MLTPSSCKVYSYRSDVLKRSDCSAMTILLLNVGNGLLASSHDIIHNNTSLALHRLLLLPVPMLHLALPHGVPLSLCLPVLSTPRHMMLERGAHSNEAKNVTLEDEAVDMRVGSDRF